MIKYRSSTILITEDSTKNTASYDIRVGFSDEDKNECFFRDIPLGTISQITLCMSGTDEDDIPYAKYLTGSTKREISTLNDVKKRLGMTDDSDSTDDQNTNSDNSDNSSQNTDSDSNSNADNSSNTDDNKKRCRTYTQLIGQRQGKRKSQCSSGIISYQLSKQIGDNK